jgi:hypothetical protein
MTDTTRSGGSAVPSSNRNNHVTSPSVMQVTLWALMVSAGSAKLSLLAVDNAPHLVSSVADFAA